MAWLYPESWGGGGFGRIVDKASDTSGSDGWFFELNTFTTGIDFSVDRATAAGLWEADSGGEITLNQWQHVAVTYDGSSTANNPAMYVDATSLAITETQAPVGTLADDSGENLMVGQHSAAPTRGFDGRIADFRLYDRMLAIAEIQAIYVARGHDSIEDGLLMRTPMNEREPGYTGPHIASTENDTGGTDVTSISIDIPAGTADGDLLVAVISPGGDTSGTAPNVTTPSGWTLVNSGNTDLPATFSTPSIWIFRRTASSEPGSYVFSQNQSCPMVAGMLTYRGIGQTEDVTSTINTGTSAFPVSPSINATAPSLILRFSCLDDDELPTPEADFYPSLTNNRVAVQDVGNVNVNGCTVGVAGQILPSGATGVTTWNPVASEQWGCLTIAFTGVDIVTDWSANQNYGNPIGDLPYGETELILRRNV
jgi:hypothetical protein